jgi:acyl-CoA thioester hydrolase
MTRLPTFDEISELPARAETVVWRDQIDANGHMNIRHYLELDARGTAALVNELGVTADYRARQRMGLFNAEHHLRYYNELLEGAHATVHVRVLDRGQSSVHLMAFLLDQDQRRVSNTLEALSVHVDLDTRRPVPMPLDIARGFDRQIAMGDELRWEVPTCGAMAIRTPVPRLGWSHLPIG